MPSPANRILRPLAWLACIGARRMRDHRAGTGRRTGGIGTASRHHRPSPARARRPLGPARQRVVRAGQESPVRRGSACAVCRKSIFSQAARRSACRAGRRSRGPIRCTEPAGPGRPAVAADRRFSTGASAHLGRHHDLAPLWRLREAMSGAPLLPGTNPTAACLDEPRVRPPVRSRAASQPGARAAADARSRASGALRSPEWRPGCSRPRGARRVHRCLPG